ncbi:MAG TPA: carbohydrate kinase family protein [Candidatus Limnocylindrales bacterium]|jgi:sugar/nucleoside kinase (ribokinase family)
MTGRDSESVDADRAVPEVVVAGHVSLDVTPRLFGPVKLEPGGLVVVGPAVMSTGGAVANTGVALHRLGVRVGLIGKVGADVFGSAVLESLALHGEHLAAGIAVSASAPTSYTIVISPPGVDRSFLHCPGANQAFSAQDVPYERLEGVRIFHFGYPPLMPRMYADRGAELRAMFARVGEAGVATSLDLCEPDPDSDAGRVDWPAVLGQVLPFVDVFAPSIDELLFMFDRPAHERLQEAVSLGSLVDHSRLAELGGHLTGMGAVVVGIKLGDQGLYLRTTPDADRMRAFCDRLGLRAEEWLDRELLSPCFQTPAVIGTTGAGDATIAGLLAALLRGAGPREATTSATAVGACSVEAVDPTSGIPSWTRVAERVAAGWPRHTVEIALRRDTTVERDATGTMVLL